MVYLPTFTTKINQMWMWLNIPYMDGMGDILAQGICHLNSSSWMGSAAGAETPSCKNGSWGSDGPYEAFTSRIQRWSMPWVFTRTVQPGQLNAASRIKHLQSQIWRGPQGSSSKIGVWWCEIRTMAGNSMSVPCMGCVLLAAICALEPVP